MFFSLFQATSEVKLDILAPLPVNDSFYNCENVNKKDTYTALSGYLR